MTRSMPDHELGDDAALRRRRRGIGRYLAAAVLVRLVDEGARVALVLLALDRSDSAAVGGLLVAALLVPHVVAAPAVGWLTDRARRPGLVLAVAALAFAGSLAAVGLLLGRAPLWVVVVILVAGGCCGPALTGGLTSQLSTLVREGAVPRAFGADSLTYNVAGITGPAVAGVLAGLGGAAPATLALATIAAAGAVAIVLVPFARPAGTADDTAGTSLTAGARAIAGDRVLRTVTLASSLGQLGPGALAVVAAVLATAQGRPAATGWLLSAIAVGGLIGSLAWAWRPAAPERAARTVMIALVGVGLPLALAAFATGSLTVSALLFGLSGVALGPFTGALFTTRERHAPIEARAQVFTISAGLKTTTAAAGAAIGGALAQVPVGTQLLLVGGSPVLAGLLGALALGARGRRREVPARGAAAGGELVAGPPSSRDERRPWA